MVSFANPQNQNNSFQCLSTSHSDLTQAQLEINNPNWLNLESISTNQNVKRRLKELGVEKADNLTDEDIAVAAINALARPTDFFLPMPPLPDDITSLHQKDMLKHMIIISDRSDKLFRIHLNPSQCNPTELSQGDIKIASNSLTRLEPYDRYVEYLSLLQDTSKHIKSDLNDYRDYLALHTARLLFGKWSSSDSPFQNRIERMINFSSSDSLFPSSTFTTSFSAFPKISANLITGSNVALINPGLSILEQLGELRFVPAKFIVIEDNPFVVKVLEEVCRIANIKNIEISQISEYTSNNQVKLNCIIFLDQASIDETRPSWLPQFAITNLSNLNGIIIAAEPSNSFLPDSPSKTEAELLELGYRNRLFAQEHYLPPYFSRVENRLDLRPSQLHTEWVKQEEQEPELYNIVTLVP